MAEIEKYTCRNENKFKEEMGSVWHTRGSIRLDLNALNVSNRRWKDKSGNRTILIHGPMNSMNPYWFFLTWCSEEQKMDVN